eukprot:XP_011680288.1 PREDICTED: uncharacterized protein LOC105445878 [Strongylocentrotus purpuratus]
MMANSFRSGLSKKLPLVGQVLLDDLRFASKATKDSIKAAVVALLEKRAKPYKNADPKDMNTTLQKSMNTEYLGDHDAAFVDMVLQDLDKILDVRDRDECEILITKPDFQEMTDESKIPGYRGVIHQFLRSIFEQRANWNDKETTNDKFRYASATMMACNPLSTVLCEELVRKPHERTAIRNAISQIILDVLKTGHSGLKGTDVSSYTSEVVDDRISILVAFWNSKIVKLVNVDDANNRIKKCLFPLKPKNINKR